jgi:hypothetical protein
VERLIEISLLWRLGNAMEPDWEITEGHVIEVHGYPNVRVRVELEPREADFSDYSASTANPAVNAIPAVVAAHPGLVTADELPLITVGSVNLAG